MLDLPRFERDAVAYCRARARERYLSWAGLAEAPALTELFDDFGHLFRDDTYGELLDADLPARQKQLLQGFVAAGFFAERTASLDDRLAAAEAAATVPWDDQALPLRAVPAVLANEPDALRRHALARAWYSATDALSSLYQERHRILVESASKLGADYTALHDEVHGLQLADLTTAARRYLDVTAVPYFEALDELLGLLGLSRADAWPADLCWLFRGRQFDTAFSSRAMVPTLHRATRDLGLDLETQSAIYLDREPRPLKSWRAHRVALEVPDDVRVVLPWFGGRLDYGLLFRMAGEAEYYANVDRTQPFAYRWVPDQAVLASYGLLFERLLSEPDWLERYLDLEYPADAVRVARLERLYASRQCAVQVLWEPTLHAGGDYDALGRQYAELFTAELGVEHAPERLLADLDDGLAAARVFRGWIFEAQHRQYLCREYDVEWYRLPRAGRFLRDLWREGSKYSVEELARFMGFTGLDLRPMAEELMAGVA